jgi:hypothetical protein
LSGNGLKIVVSSPAEDGTVSGVSSITRSAPAASPWVARPRAPDRRTRSAGLRRECGRATGLLLSGRERRRWRPLDEGRISPLHRMTYDASPRGRPPRAPRAGWKRVARCLARKEGRSRSRIDPHPKGSW